MLDYFKILPETHPYIWSRHEPQQSTVHRDTCCCVSSTHVALVIYLYSGVQSTRRDNGLYCPCLSHCFFFTTTSTDLESLIFFFINFYFIVLYVLIFININCIDYRTHTSKTQMYTIQQLNYFYGNHFTIFDYHLH